MDVGIHVDIDMDREINIDMCFRYMDKDTDIDRYLRSTSSPQVPFAIMKQRPLVAKLKYIEIGGSTQLPIKLTSTLARNSKKKKAKKRKKKKDNNDNNDDLAKKKKTIRRNNNNSKMTKIRNTEYKHAGVDSITTIALINPRRLC